MHQKAHLLLSSAHEFAFFSCAMLKIYTTESKLILLACVNELVLFQVFFPAEGGTAKVVLQSGEVYDRRDHCSVRIYQDTGSNWRFFRQSVLM